MILFKNELGNKMQRLSNKIISWATDLEENTTQQIVNLSKMPFIYKHVAVMPDAHFGLGSTVGSVIATQGAIIPAAVGVDIGCGMCAAKLPFKIDALPDNLFNLRSLIESQIPVGASAHKEPLPQSYQNIPVFSNEINNHDLCQLGTLGGGNHFIEICKDENDFCWIMLHSGSRGHGYRVANKHIDKAKGVMKKYLISLPDPDLAYFVQKTDEFDNYLSDLIFAQNYALINREIMVRIIIKIIYGLVKPPGGMLCAPSIYINCHHNYTRLENHFGKNIYITRKGAISAQLDELGIIPGSMGTKSYIVKGKGNLDSFHSCSHGAGRKMSRNAAKKLFTLADFEAQTEGVECNKTESFIDEIPGAYKDIDTVMENQKDLVEIVHTLKQLICIKG